jgi:DNA ligase-1
MLADTIDDIKQLDGRWPLLASPKLDGIRALIINGQVVSRNMKPIRNAYVQEKFKDLPEFLDGELIVGSPTDPDCFRNTSSGVMSAAGQPDVSFYIFDWAIPCDPFVDRHKLIQDWYKKQKHRVDIALVHQEVVRNAEALVAYEAEMLAQGFEGVMVRTGTGKYKEGRSTIREGYLMKLKQFKDSEAVVLKLVEQMENTNEATKDELGRTKRSSHKAGKVGKDTLGALKVRDIHSGVEFEIGTGMDDNTRRRYWIMPQLIKGKIVKYKYFPSGSKDKPRFPVFLGIRGEGDM